MKRNIAFFFLMAFMNLLGTKAFAYDIAVENDDSVTIYYNYIHAAKELEVTYKKNNSLDGGYSGKVVIPSEVTFKGITRKVTSIGKRAFYHSPYVTEVILPSTVNTICEWAFGEIISLTSLNIPNSVTTIKDCAFGDCRNLTSITIPSSVKIIGQGVFLGCDVLESIEVDAENSVYDSRYGCNAIIESASNTLISGCNKTTLPNDITTIDALSFAYCYELTSINIPNGVKTIGDKAFLNCERLASVTIPNSVTKIGYYAFTNWSYTKLKIISHIEDPTGDTGNGFGDLYLSATLYVPEGTLEKYKSADGWKNFANIIEGIPSGINSVTMNEGEECERFNIAGKKLTEPQRGINIIRMTDGTTKKVVVK